MKKILLFFSIFYLSSLSFAQIGLPIQTSLLPKNNLVVNYDFSKSTGYTRGSTAVSNIAGTASGNALLVNAPIFMNSLGLIMLNGTNQYLMSPNLRTYFKALNATVQKSFTMSLWIYPTSLNGVVISEHDSQTLNSGYYTSNIELVNGAVRYKVYNSTTIESTPISLNQWYHIAMVYDGTSVKAYLNGILQGTQIYDRLMPTSTQYYGIGSQTNTNMGSGVYGNFHLAQFKLHNLPLTDFEIQKEYDLRSSELDYTIHSPSTNSNPTYWGVSSAWANETTFSQDHYTPWLNNTRLGWAAAANDLNQWITLNYDEPAYIKGVVIQPRANSGGQFVTKVNIETSATGAAPWTRVLSNAPVSTSTTNDGNVIFPTSVFAKAVKVLPVDWSNHITLRLGLLAKPNNLVTDGLVLNLDAANIKSYQGTGAVWSDLSSSSNHASISLSPTHTSSTGLTFNGSTQYGRIPSVAGVTDFTNTQQYSIEVWFNPSNGQANSAEAELLEKWNFTNEAKYPFTIRFNEGASSMIVSCYDGSNFPYVSATGFSVNTWAQLVAVFDFVGKTLTVYRNGVSVTSRSLVGVNQVSNSSPVGIAGRVPANAAGVQVPFKGTIGIIRFYNKSLSSNEVLQNFNTFKLRFGL